MIDGGGDRSAGDDGGWVDAIIRLCPQVTDFWEEFFTILLDEARCMRGVRGDRTIGTDWIGGGAGAWCLCVASTYNARILGGWERGGCSTLERDECTIVV